MYMYSHYYFALKRHMAAVLQPTGRGSIAAALECIPRDVVQQTWPIELLLVYFADSRLVPLGSLVEPRGRVVLGALVLEREVAAVRPFSFVRGQDRVCVRRRVPRTSRSHAHKSARKHARGLSLILRAPILCAYH
jgi:hypothetical protein